MTTTVTLYERAQAIRTVDEWIEEHTDEILANGGALPPALEQLLDEAEGDFQEKMERVGLKIRELKANAGIAEGQKKAVQVEVDRLRQRQQMWENAEKALRNYAHRCLTAAGLTSVKRPLVSVRIQANPVTAKHSYESPELVAIYDADAREALSDFGNPTPTEPPQPPHPLAQFITITRTATLDTKALLAAMLADEEELVAKAMAKITDDDLDETMFAGLQAIEDAAERADAIANAVAARRNAWVAEEMARRFPGCTLVRGSHVRVA